MIGKWHKCLDENKIVSTTLIALSKAFDSLPHDLQVAKLEAYGLDTKTLRLHWHDAVMILKLNKIIMERPPVHMMPTGIVVFL